MTLKTIAIGAVLLGQALLPGTASAVCLDRKPPVAAEACTADAIVIGRILSEQGLREDPTDPEGTTAYNVKVKVMDRLKGTLPDTIVIRNENTSGRYPMAVGEEHLLFVSKDGQQLWVNNCGNSSAMPEGEKLVGQIRAQRHSR